MAYDSEGPTGLLNAPSQPPDPGHPADRRRMVLAFVLAGIAGLLLVAYLVMVFSLSNKVPSGTTVAGVDIGGLGRVAASSKLEEVLGERADQPVRLTAAGTSYELDPAAAGLRLDADATVDEAYVGSVYNPATLVGMLDGGQPVTPVVDVEGRKLDATLDRLAKQIDRKPREGAITFEGGRPHAVLPQAGQELDRAAAKQTLRTEYLRASGPVALPVSDAPPAASKQDVRQAMQSFAEPAMSGPVQLEVGDGSLEVTPAELAPALSMRASAKGSLEPKLDGRKLLDQLDEKLREFLPTPEDASIRITDSGPEVVPSRAGESAAPDQLAEALLPVLDKSGGQRVARVPTKEQPADLTTKELEGLGVEEEISEFSTEFPYANYRNVNIGRAAELINGSLVLPGETFSMNDTVGERTRENGFTGGYVIKGGKLAVELGGGVSQMATTMYNAAFFGGMKDVEHRPHGFYISRYPEGREATVYWGALDLKWKNTTPHAVYVQAYTDQASPGSTGSVTVRLWSTKYYEVESKTSDRYDVVPYDTIVDKSKDGCVDQVGMDGFKVDVHRWLYRNGERVKSEKDVVTYNPEDKITCKHPTETPG